MPTEKISEYNKFAQCRHPEHYPPAHRVFSPGTWRHTCPKCGAVTTFVVRPTPWMAQ